ncbi:MAG: CinA family protein [Novosphingobium sp.]|nr:CinA family protein [Novosphingobium sp.]
MDSILPDDVLALARRVVEENAKIGRKVAVAESCTGGLVSAAITEIPGSSAVLDRGFVTYSNEAKQQLLGVPEDILEAFGAVSAATVWSMAQGAIKHSDADVAVAISGVAGPDGGTELKPVGTVVFAKAERGEEEVNAEERRFPDEGRGDIRYRALLVALELLLP